MAGDTIFDNELCYESTWGDSLKNINFGVQVEKAATGDELSPMKLNIMEPNKNRTKVDSVGKVKTVQREFLEFLKTGDLNHFSISRK